MNVQASVETPGPKVRWAGWAVSVKVFTWAAVCGACKFVIGMPLGIPILRAVGTPGPVGSFGPGREAVRVELLLAVRETVVM